MRQPIYILAMMVSLILTISQSLAFLQPISSGVQSQQCLITAGMVQPLSLKQHGCRGILSPAILFSSSSPEEPQQETSSETTSSTEEKTPAVTSSSTTTTEDTSIGIYDENEKPYPIDLPSPLLLASSIILAIVSVGMCIFFFWNNEICI